MPARRASPAAARGCGLGREYLCAVWTVIPAIYDTVDADAETAMAQDLTGLRGRAGPHATGLLVLLFSTLQRAFVFPCLTLRRGARELRGEMGVGVGAADPSRSEAWRGRGHPRGQVTRYALAHAPAAQASTLEPLHELLYTLRARMLTYVFTDLLSVAGCAVHLTSSSHTSKAEPQQAATRPDLRTDTESPLGPSATLPLRPWVACDHPQPDRTRLTTPRTQNSDRNIARPPRSRAGHPSRRSPTRETR